MYLNFFGLQTKPFNPTPDQDFLYLSPSHKQALGSILYGVKEKKGFISVTGQVGLGKTTILRSFLAQVDQANLHTIYLLNPNISFTRVLKTLLRELGHDPVEGDDAEMVEQLHMVLIKEYQKGRTVVLLIDEAQNMPLATLEHLRMLSNLETPKEKLIQIVLLGQPELDALLDRYELRQLRQRIAVRALLLPLSEQESVQYIQHRLDIAGGKGKKLFTESALSLIVAEAKGAPRQLNILCDNAFVTALGYQKKLVTVSIAKEVIRDLTGQPSSTPWRLVPVSVGGWVLAFLIVLLPLTYFSFSDSISLHEIGKIFNLEEKAQQDVVDAKKSEVFPDQGDRSLAEEVQGWITKSVSVTWDTLRERVISGIDSTTTHAPPEIDVVLENRGDPGQPRDAIGSLNDSFPPVSAELVDDPVSQTVASITQLNRERGAQLPSQNVNSPSKEFSDSQLTATSIPQVESDLQVEEGPDSSAENIVAPQVASDSVPTLRNLQVAAENVSEKDDISAVAVRENPVALPHVTNKKSDVDVKTFPVTKIMKEGQTLAGLMEEVYGSSSPSILRLVLDRNRQIVNVRKMYPGQQIVFPRLDKENPPKRSVARTRDGMGGKKKKARSVKKVFARSSTQAQKLDRPKGVKRSPPFAMAIVKEGDTLEKLAKVVYGSSNPQYIQRVLDYNPEISNPKKIIPGQDIAFPRMVDVEGDN